MVNVDQAKQATPAPTASLPETYKSEDYFFSVDYNKALQVNELGRQGGYLFFVRFEQYSSGKYPGFAIGVSELGLKSEVSRLKSNFSADGNAELVEEKDTTFKNLPAQSLLYKPTEEALQEDYLEDREVIIVYKEPYTYSISALPEAIPGVEENFKFTN